MNRKSAQGFDRGAGSAVVVSPHLDDAAFSIPCLLLERARRGETTTVCTVFTRGASGVPLHGRIGEDLLAAGIGGFLPDHGPFTDAPFRREPHADFMSIVFGRGSDDAALVRDIASWIRSRIEDRSAAFLLAPLGVGRHVDHRLAHFACVMAATDCPGVGIEFYEDRPYAFVDQAAQVRLSELGFESRPDTGRFFDSLFCARYVKSFLGSGDFDACRAAYENILSCARRAAPVLQSLVRTAGSASEAWKLASAYASQLRDFTGGFEEFARECRASALRMGAGADYAERTFCTRV